MIGSAAVALHDVAVTPPDVDVLLGRTDATLLLPRLGVEPAVGDPGARFRSALFVRWPGTAIRSSSWPTSTFTVSRHAS